MKKIIAIFLLTVYLSSTTEIYQLLKLPFLAEHFLEHKNDNQNLSFVEFLELHYANNKKSDESDKKLPFKSHDIVVNIALTGFLQKPIFFKIESPEFKELNPVCIYDELFIGSAHFDAIWNPPKSC